MIGCHGATRVCERWVRGIKGLAVAAAPIQVQECVFEERCKRDIYQVTGDSPVSTARAESPNRLRDGLRFVQMQMMMAG